MIVGAVAFVDVFFGVEVDVVVVDVVAKVDVVAEVDVVVVDVVAKVDVVAEFDVEEGGN